MSKNENLSLDEFIKLFKLSHDQHITDQQLKVLGQLNGVDLKYHGDALKAAGLQQNSQSLQNQLQNTFELNSSQDKNEPIKVESPIQYKKMSLFDAPKGSILVHACNAQGVWGSGIAKEFKSKFPKSFKEYNEYCKNNPSYYTDGTALVTNQENGYQVGCLITSSNYGEKLNAEQTILINTKHSLTDLAKKSNQTTFYSNKFNSGFFKVPWDHTEKLIKDFVKKYNKTWIICDPNLEEK